MKNDNYFRHCLKCGNETKVWLAFLQELAKTDLAFNF